MLSCQLLNGKQKIIQFLFNCCNDEIFYVQLPIFIKKLYTEVILTLLICNCNSLRVTSIKINRNMT